MKKARVTIGVVAPGCTLSPVVADQIVDLARKLYPPDVLELRFHPQCFLSSGHFAGPDQARADAFVAMANDPEIDSIWFARGGYGACRIVEGVIPRLNEAGRLKTYMGYSDAGTLLGGLYAYGIGRPVHGPMPADITRDGGEQAVTRAMRWLVGQDQQALEPNLTAGTSFAAFNITILSQMMGTGWQADLTGHVLMLEEVSEYMYRIDRSLCHIFGNPMMRRLAGVRLGRCSLIPPNEPDFGIDEEAVIQHWCAAAGVTFFGRADIGHDIANKVVPFGQI